MCIYIYERAGEAQRETARETERGGERERERESARETDIYIYMCMCMCIERDRARQNKRKTERETERSGECSLSRRLLDRNHTVALHELLNHHDGAYWNVCLQNHPLLQQISWKICKSYVPVVLCGPSKISGGTWYLYSKFSSEISPLRGPLMLQSQS